MPLKLCIFLSGILIAITSLFSQDSLFENMKLDLKPDQPRQFIFTNKKAAFWYGEAQQPNHNGFEGYTILEQRYLQDYSLFADGQPVDRGAAEDIQLYPDRLVRRYARFTEVFHFVDSLNLLMLDIVPADSMELEVRFRFAEPITANLWNWNREKQSLETEFHGFGQDKPALIACEVSGQAAAVKSLFLDSEKKGEDSGRGIGFKMQASGKVTVAVMFSQTKPELAQMSALVSDSSRIAEVRGKRIRRLLQNAVVRTGNLELDRAYRWALISMDDLVTEQRGKGIWAGLPWFNNYWGRDSFISFTGALLCSGQFDEARQVLLSFSDFQNRDTSSQFYGRIPNRVMLKEIIYNTVDGTPWFVKSCENYVKYSGDTAFIKEIFPALRRAMEGALKYHVDKLGFLTHADAETWMDAVGSEGPWSPRGNRAVEIQALWLEQLRISIRWARETGDEALAKKWTRIEQKTTENFAEYFWNSGDGDLYDHLNEDGTPDKQLRPNQIFALTIPESLVLEKSQAEKVLTTVVDKLTYPWGVGSLWQKDPNFHPYHHYAPYYVPDAAYHNGIVWTWLAGPLLTALFPHNAHLAYNLLQNEARQILQKDAAGSYSELLEAWPRPDEASPRISGTVSQAWNLAEFIRNVNQDLLGIKPDLSAGKLLLEPHLPSDMSAVEFTFRLGETPISGRYEKKKDNFAIMLEPVTPLDKTMDLTVKLPDGRGELVSFQTLWDMNSAANIRISHPGGEAAVKFNGVTVPNVQISGIDVLPDLKFCEPSMDMDLPALKGPEFDLVTPEDAVRKPDSAARLLFSKNDPAGDDRGPNGKYVYPQNPAFKPGIFDGRSVKIWRDDTSLYFKIEYENLVNPGWRPESGYQLTYTAIALNFGEEAGPRKTRVEMNANYSVSKDYAYNFMIFVGNGYRLVDSDNKILAEYRPQDNDHPIGFVKDKSVQFAVPLKYFPVVRLRNAYVMIGGQDDHGAGGVGEFRTVGRQAGEWQGGGGDQSVGNPSVYDVIEVE
ncbi:MAG: amylo-alpha-1,6-glucosidase [Calditrichia bacterium]